MSEFPLPDPTDTKAYDKALAKTVVGELKPLAAPIEICDYDPAWPELYEREAVRIRAALGPRIVRLEHAGSTSVPTLPAKPIIDILLECPTPTTSLRTCRTSKLRATGSGSASPTGSSTGCSEGRTRESTSPCTRLARSKSIACCCSGTGCARTRPTASATRLSSAS